MNEETIIYSVITAIFGIIVVILSLYIFSLVMIALKALFKDKNKEEKPSRIKEQGKKAPQEKEKGTDNDLGWITAAVCAYLAESEDEKVPLSVHSWQPQQLATYNPWVFSPKVSQTWTGE